MHMISYHDVMTHSDSNTEWWAEPIGDFEKDMSTKAVKTQDVISPNFLRIFFHFSAKLLCLLLWFSVKFRRNF